MMGMIMNWSNPLTFMNFDFMVDYLMMVNIWLHGIVYPRRYKLGNWNIYENIYI